MTLIATARLRSQLFWPLLQRDVSGRYRGSKLGLLWSFLNPLFMLAIFTLVFGAVFQTRWDTSTSGYSHSLTEFSVILFVGMTVFQIFAEVVNRAPGLILSNPNYVTKVVFPLELLPLVAVGSALFHAAASFSLIFAFSSLFAGGLPATAWLLPFVLAPLVILTAGVAWFLASIGTYLRDVSQITGSVVTALMFLSGVFFPRSSLPDWIEPWAALGPFTLPMEMARDVVVFGRQPAWIDLIVYSCVAVLVAFLGFMFFEKTRKGFADVL